MKKLVQILMFLSIPVTVWSQGFTVNNTNGNLLDACGNNFIMKGINVPLSWYVSNVNGSIAALKTNTKSNCLRIVVNENTPNASWQTTVTNCINNKIIPMVELHDVTGSTDPAALKRMGEFWAARASYFNQPNIKKHILINLANEWGTWQTATNKNTVWRDAVIAAIKPMRDAGITTTIVIDAVGYGQDIDDAYNIRTYAKDIQRADNNNLGGTANSTAKSNLLFSIHMYCEWKKGGDNIGIINTIKGMGIPIIVGEFGYQHATDGSCDIDEQSIMNTCQSGGIGWLAWSQKGNGSPVEFLDLCTDWNCTQLSTWGNTVINGTNGTKTAVECSVFSSTSCTTTTCTTPAPIVTATRAFCQNTTATQLTATGTALKWYTVETGGTASSTAPIPATSTTGVTTYYVSQTLNGCEGPRASITVTVNAAPVVESYMQVNGAAWAAQSAATLCAGNSIAIGPHPVETTGWTWTGPTNFTSSVREISFSGITTAQGGTYTATYKDVNGCSGSLGIPVTVNASPEITITAPANNSTISSSPILISTNVTGNNISNVQFYNGATLIGSDASAPYSYSWAINTNGTYTVNAKATNSSNCADTATVKVTLSIITGLEGVETSTETSCFPNPFSHSFTIQSPGSFSYTIYDLAGIEIEKGMGNLSSVVGKFLSTGTYLLKIESTSKGNLIKINKL